MAEWSIGNWIAVIAVPTLALLFTGWAIGRVSAYRFAEWIIYTHTDPGPQRYRMLRDLWGKPAEWFKEENSDGE